MTLRLASKRRLGLSDIEVGPLGFGCVPLGNLYSSMGAADVFETIAAARQSGIDYFDTAPFYGFGLSERRLGVALEVGHKMSVSTKVGRRIIPARGRETDHGIFENAPPFVAEFDFTYDGVMRQVEDSLQRLGQDRIDCLVIHDLGLWHMQTEAVLNKHFADLKTGGLRALDKLRSEGVVRAIGAGANELTMCSWFIEAAEIDFILLALKFTLLDQTAYPAMLDAAQKGGTGVIVGAPFQSGILATGTKADVTLQADYGNADAKTIDRVRRIEQFCERYDVPLPAAALQFPLLHSAVASVLAGMRSVQEVKENVKHMLWPIPDEFWNDLRAANLIPQDIDLDGATR